MQNGSKRFAMRLAALAGISLASPAFANSLEWRGFFSTGASFTDSKVPYQGITRNTRVTDETFLGLNLSKEMTKEWRVAGQILGRAGQADSAAKVDWAFVTYEPDKSYSATLGKQKIPMWMISEYIDVGRAYPWVVPPEEVYSVFPLKSFTGASVLYSLDLGGGRLSLSPYGGDVVYESRPNAPDLESKLRGSNMLGLAVDWTYDIVLFRVAYNQASWDLDLGTSRNFGERRLQMASAGLKIEGNGYLLMSEFVAIKDREEEHYLNKANRLLAEAAATADADAATELTTEATMLRQKISGTGYYATFGKAIFDDYLVHLTYAADRRPYQPENSRDQSSVTLGLNYDINVDAVIKLEGKNVMLPERSQGLFSQKTNEDQATIYRLGFSMVF